MIAIAALGGHVMGADIDMRVIKLGKVCECGGVYVGGWGVVCVGMYVGVYSFKNTCVHSFKYTTMCMTHQHILTTSIPSP